jgi:hypothetical protein
MAHHDPGIAGALMKKILAIAALMIMLPAAVTLAQEPAAAPEVAPAETVLLPDGTEAPVELASPPEINPNTMPSLLFTYWEHVAVLDAKRARGAGGDTRTPLRGEFGANEGQENYKPSPEERELNLSGIVFKSHEDWTIWLNGKRVTPDALPSDAIEIRVSKDYIDIKWFDAYTNQIFPIRLRPHQRFNFDTRIFLPS